MVKVYSVEWCPECVKLKKYLNKQGVEFEEVIVADSKENRDEVIKVSGQMTVPVMTANDIVIVGFKKAEIDNAIQGIK
ncbi:MAG: glutaredoxin domain-containing protein [Clostridium sp.]